MNDITLRQTFTAAGAGEACRVTGPALHGQVNGSDCTLQGSNFPDVEGSWQALGTISGYAPLAVTTSFAWIRVVADGACDVRVSAAQSPAAGDVIGGGSGLTNAELRAAAVPVTIANGALASRSGTITTGGTAQQLAAANSSRRGFSVLNLSSGDIWINELGTAAASQPSIKVVSGAYFETPVSYGSVGAISIFGATTGQAFTAREW